MWLIIIEINTHLKQNLNKLTEYDITRGIPYPLNLLFSFLLRPWSTSRAFSRFFLLPKVLKFYSVKIKIDCHTLLLSVDKFENLRVIDILLFILWRCLKILEILYEPKHEVNVHTKVFVTLWQHKYQYVILCLAMLN